MQITPKTKINDLLTHYPKLENFLMDLNPKYKKLKNPILRRTVAKIATLTQVAKIGGYDVKEFVNLLRKEVGEAPLENITLPKEENQHTPEWITTPAIQEIDASKLLSAHKNPLAEVTIALKQIGNNEHIVLKSDFLPSPLIDTLQKQGYDVYTQELDENHYITFIHKP